MMSSTRKCVNDPNGFCYMCGEYTLKNRRLNITTLTKQLYLAYFGVHLGDQDKSWAPHIACKTCYETLRRWKKGEAFMKFGVPMIWREPRNHFDDCYFCIVNVKGYNRLKKRKWEYPNLESALRPVPHDNDIPVPVFSVLPEIDYSESEDEAMAVGGDANAADSDFEQQCSQQFSTGELSDLIRDLNLSKRDSELLASRLKEKNCVTSDVRITWYRTREKSLLPFFTKEDDLVYCNNISALMLKLDIDTYSPTDWRLFIDSSTRSLKCVLVHNGNHYGTIPIAHSTKLKEEYENVKKVLQKIEYESHKWSICVDLKMVNFLLGQQSGYTKYPCFLCLWDSRDKAHHWDTKAWSIREHMNVGSANIIHEPLVQRKYIILPPLHIKLGIMKQFVKALDKDGDCFTYICRALPKLSMEKLKAGVFNGPQIRQLVKDNNFVKSMTENEKNAWTSFVSVIKNFLGNKRSENYQEIVETMLKNLKVLGINMSSKIHYLHNHLENFPENLGDYSEEQGERFHQDFRTMEERYQGKWDDHMMADYCWSLKRDHPHDAHRRKSYRKRFGE